MMTTTVTTARAMVAAEILGSGDRISAPCVDERRVLRRLAGATHTTTPVVVVEGDSAPECVGEGFRFTTRAGAPVRFPNAYRRAWGKPVYHASTIRVTVGRAWLVAWRLGGGVYAVGA